MAQITVEYIEKGAYDLDLVRPLWEKLTLHHKALTQHFRERYLKTSFSARKKELLKKSEGGDILIDLARDLSSREYIGYCVSTLSAQKLGEIDSIYVEPAYRGCGIGNELMQRALYRMEANSAKRIIVAVGEGNENVFEFYRRFNFYPRATILEQTESYKSEGVG